MIGEYALDDLMSAESYDDREDRVQLTHNRPYRNLRRTKMTTENQDQSSVPPLIALEEKPATHCWPNTDNPGEARGTPFGSFADFPLDHWGIAGYSLVKRLNLDSGATRAERKAIVRKLFELAKAANSLPRDAKRDFIQVITDNAGQQMVRFTWTQGTTTTLRGRE